jgi:hypothetical protein
MQHSDSNLRLHQILVMQILFLFQTCSVLLMIFTSVALYSVSTELKNRNKTNAYIDMLDVMNDRGKELYI